MLCNTVHYWVPSLNFENIEIINIINITKKYIYKNSWNTVLLLATKGTYATELYFDYFKKDELVIPSKYEDEIMKIIYDCKLGNDNVNNLKDLIYKLSNKYNFEAIILGCTELSILLEDIFSICNKAIIDPISITAQYIIDINKIE